MFLHFFHLSTKFLQLFIFIVEHSGVCVLSSDVFTLQMVWVGYATAGTPAFQKCYEAHL